MTAPAPPIKLALSIDDERVDQRLYKRVMMRTGLIEEVMGFQLAEEALEFLRGEGRPPVDMIFLDINMPRMDGFEFLEQACSEFGPEIGGISVVMLTTSLNPHDKARADEFPVVKDYMLKPIKPEDIVRVVDKIRPS